MWVILIQSVKGLIRTKKLRDYSFCLTAIEQGHCMCECVCVCFPAFELDLKHQISWVSSLPAFRQKLHTGSPQSPACWLQTLGLVSFRKYVRQFLIVNQSLSLPLPLSLSLTHTHSHSQLVPFSWRTLTNTVLVCLKILGTRKDF